MFEECKKNRKKEEKNSKYLTICLDVNIALYFGCGNQLFIDNTVCKTILATPHLYINHFQKLISMQKTLKENPNKIMQPQKTTEWHKPCHTCATSMPCFPCCRRDYDGYSSHTAPSAPPPVETLIQCSAVQYSTVQYSSVQYSIVQLSVRRSGVESAPVSNWSISCPNDRRTALPALHCTVLYSTALHCLYCTALHCIGAVQCTTLHCTTLQ